MKYLFETSEFGISDQGIHLLRSGFNYKTYLFSEIDSITIERGKEIKNWLIVFLLSIALLSYALYFIVHMVLVVANYLVDVIYIESIVLPLIPCMMGGYGLYVSLRSVTILRLNVNGKSERLSLRSMEKDGQLADSLRFLKEKMKTKISINTLP